MCVQNSRASVLQHATASTRCSRAARRITSVSARPRPWRRNGTHTKVLQTDNRAPRIVRERRRGFWRRGCPIRKARLKHAGASGENRSSGDHQESPDGHATSEELPPGDLVCQPAIGDELADLCRMRDMLTQHVDRHLGKTTSRPIVANVRAEAKQRPDAGTASS